MYLHSIFSILVIFSLIYSTIAIFLAHEENFLTVRELPPPGLNQYVRFEFTSYQTIPMYLKLRFGLMDQAPAQPYHFADPLNVKWNQLFPEYGGLQLSTSCFFYSSDDPNHSSPTFAGLMSLWEQTSTTLDFIVLAFIPHLSVISCLISLDTQHHRKLTLPLQLIFPSSWSIQNHVSVYPFVSDKYIDPLSYIELSLSYTAGDSILAGERMDYLFFSVAFLPPNVILPLAIGFTSPSEKRLQNIYYLSNLELTHIVDIWAMLKPGSSSTRSGNLTPSDPAFYEQTFDIPSPSCGFDIRLVFSHTLEQFVLVTGDKPATNASCTIPIPIFHLHGSIARSSTTLRRQNLNKWDGTQISVFIQLTGRLFQASEYVNDPRWWFYENPHLAPYSTFLTPLQTLNPDLSISFEHQLIFIGPTPSFSFYRLFCHPQLSSQQFFTPRGGFLSKFGYFTSPTDIRYPGLMKQLTINPDDPFGHIYQFLEDYRGYLALFLTFTVPERHISPFSLHLLVHRTDHDDERIQLAHSSLWKRSIQIPTMSDTEITYVLSIEPTYTLQVVQDNGLTSESDIIPNNFYMFPFGMELTHFLPAYELRPHDKLLPRECSVDMFTLLTDPPSPYIPPEPPQIRIEQNPVFSANFADDVSYFVSIDNLHIVFGVTIQVLCTYDLVNDLPKFHPLPNRWRQLVVAQRFACQTFNYEPPFDYRYHSFQTYFQQCIMNDLLSFPPPPKGTWNYLSELPITSPKHSLLAVSTTPITSQEEFSQFVKKIVQILKDGTYFDTATNTSHPSLFKDCITADMIRDPLVFGSSINTPSFYSGEAMFPRSHSLHGWEESQSAPFFSIKSLALDTNCAILFMSILQTPECSIPTLQYNQHTFFTAHGTYLFSLGITQRNDLADQFLQTPKLRFYGPSSSSSSYTSSTSFSNHSTLTDDSTDPTDHLLIGRRPGGSECYSNYQCLNDHAAHSLSKSSRLHQDCFQGKCLTSNPKLTPFQFRELDTLKKYRYARSLATIDTSRDYIPPPGFSRLQKLIFYIGIPILVIALVFLWLEIYHLYCRKKLIKNNALLDNTNNNDHDSA